MTQRIFGTETRSTRRFRAGSARFQRAMGLLTPGTLDASEDASYHQVHSQARRGMALAAMTQVRVSLPTGETPVPRA